MWLLGSLEYYITQVKHSAMHPAPRECPVNGSPGDRFSKEEQAMG